MKTDPKNHRFLLRKVSPETLKIIDFPLVFKCFFDFQGFQHKYRFWVDLGGSWRPPGHLLGPLGASLGRLGGILARLGASWERLGTSWPPSSLQDRKKLEKPTKNHQKPPQHKPDLIWNGKRRLFSCAVFSCFSQVFVKFFLGFS